MDTDSAIELRRMWDDLKRRVDVPDGLRPGDTFLTNVQGTRVALYINVTPTEAKRGGGVAPVIDERRQTMQHMLDHVNQFREPPLEIVAEYIDTAYLRSRLMHRPEGRRLVHDAQQGRFEVILFARARELGIGLSDRDLDEFQSAILPASWYAVDVLNMHSDAVLNVEVSKLKYGQSHA